VISEEIAVIVGAGQAGAELAAGLGCICGCAVP